MGKALATDSLHSLFEKDDVLTELKRQKQNWKNVTTFNRNQRKNKNKKLKEINGEIGARKLELKKEYNPEPSFALSTPPRSSGSNEIPQYQGAF